MREAPQAPSGFRETLLVISGGEWMKTWLQETYNESLVCSKRSCCLKVEFAEKMPRQFSAEFWLEFAGNTPYLGNLESRLSFPLLKQPCLPPS